MFAGSFLEAELLLGWATDFANEPSRNRYRSIKRRAKKVAGEEGEVESMVNLMGGDHGMSPFPSKPRLCVFCHK